MINSCLQVDSFLRRSNPYKLKVKLKIHHHRQTKQYKIESLDTIYKVQEVYRI